MAEVQYYRKANPPATGPAFDQSWMESYQPFAGAPAIMFDTSKLTLADFAEMRTHPQVNASLSLMTFMLHQCDWYIECEDKKIAALVEENMRLIWTQLIRGISTSYWAGYSPMVLEWDNANNGKNVFIDKVKDIHPTQASVHWKEVESSYRPRPGDMTGPSSHYIVPKVKVYDGIDKIGLGYPIPPVHCVHPDTKILCADLVWRRAGDLRVGQKIVAFDEDASGASHSRKYRQAEIQVNNLMTKDSVIVSTADGSPITCSADHPFLVRRPAMLRGMERPVAVADGGPCPRCGDDVVQSPVGRKKVYCSDRCQREMARQNDKNEGIIRVEHWTWVNAEDLQPNDQIGFLSNPWESDESYEAGWLSGMYDGEGTSNGKNLVIYQNGGPVQERLKAVLTDRGYQVAEYQTGDEGCIGTAILGGLGERMRFAGEMRPQRLQGDTNWVGTSVKLGRSVTTTAVTSVERVGTQPVASIQTSTGTFITGGYLSHNTLWYPVLREHGNMYGRKLLASAFAPWYFSLLMHLFSNRYFERFGEPTPIGRAPFQEEYQFKDEFGADIEMTGKQVIENAMLRLRSSGSVMLPSDRDPSASGAGRSEYLYDIEYLESAMRGADFERYLSRLDEEISLSIFTPMLLMRSGDRGSLNLGVQHTQTWLWALNALAMDIKEYIDPYICERIKEFNFSEKAPRVEWKIRPLGKDNIETIRAVTTALIGSGKVKVDLDQLGMALGMTLTEIKEVKQDVPAALDPNDPNNLIGNQDGNGQGPGSDTRIHDRPNRKVNTPAGVGRPGSGGPLNG